MDGPAAEVMKKLRGRTRDGKHRGPPEPPEPRSLLDSPVLQSSGPLR